MKFKIISIFIVGILTISITACSSNKSSTNTGNTNKTTSNVSNNTNNNLSSNTNNEEKSNASNSPAQSNSPSGKVPAENNSNSVAEAYKAVLQNKAEFFSTDDSKNLLLNDFLVKEKNNGVIYKITHFAVVPMDGDKIPEVVLELTVGNYPEFYEILHYMNGKVYGYTRVYRALEGLKTDGTFWASGGASDNECEKLRFNLNNCEVDVLGGMKSSQGTDGLTVSYFINDKVVTKESFDVFRNKQGSKKDVEWYSFSEDNIKSIIKLN